ncbi:MAG: hypothetical protein JSR34_01930 [Proteobacteria bacterium]|nr:hypothetical protein [Pseudomonadota bacterium]
MPVAVACAQPAIPANGQDATTNAAMQSGLDAAKNQQWRDAAKAFEQAREKDPFNPAVLFNGGLAESKIPGHEVRAIARLQSYLMVSPQAPNAAAVKQSIVAIDAQARHQAKALLAFEEQLLPDMPKGSDMRREALADITQDYVLIGDLDKARQYMDENAANECTSSTSAAERTILDYDDPLPTVALMYGNLRKDTFRIVRILSDRRDYDAAGQFVAALERARCPDAFLVYPYLYQARSEHDDGLADQARRDAAQASRHARATQIPVHELAVGETWLYLGDIDAAQAGLEVIATAPTSGPDCPWPAVCSSTATQAKVRERGHAILEEAIGEARKAQSVTNYAPYYDLGTRGRYRQANEAEAHELYFRMRDLDDGGQYPGVEVGTRRNLTQLLADLKPDYPDLLLAVHNSIDYKLEALETLALIRKDLDL